MNERVSEIRITSYLCCIIHSLYILEAFYFTTKSVPCRSLHVDESERRNRPPAGTYLCSGGGREYRVKGGWSGDNSRGLPCACLGVWRTCPVNMLSADISPSPRWDFTNMATWKPMLGNVSRATPVDLTLTELRWTSVNIVHTQFPLSPPPILVIENAYTTQLTALYFLGHVGSVRCWLTPTTE